LEIRLIGTEQEVEEAIALIAQNFTIRHDSETYREEGYKFGRSLIVKAKPSTPQTGNAVAQPGPYDAVLGGGGTRQTWGLSDRDRAYYDFGET
jgi:hypothetical protein